MTAENLNLCLQDGLKEYMKFIIRQSRSDADGTYVRATVKCDFVKDGQTCGRAFEIIETVKEGVVNGVKVNASGDCLKSGN